MSEPITDVRAQLQRDEGLRLNPYLDCCGKPWRQCACKVKGALTIGYGYNLDHGLPETICDALLAFKITQASADVFSHLPWTMQLDEARRGVFVNMAYNMGIGGLLGFTKMLKHAEAHNWSAAAAELLDSKYATQVGPRAPRLADQLRSGEWQ